MDHQTATDNKVLKPNVVVPSKSEIATELRRQADQLRDEGQTAAEFWLAEQYERTANLIN